MNIGIIGAGYVGLVTGACLADFGHTVLCIETDREKLALLDRGESPIYETGLKDILQRNVYYQRLKFSDNIDKLFPEYEVIFICVGTPALEDGRPDMSQVDGVSRQIGERMENYLCIVNKSTVPVGSTGRVRNIIENEVKKKGVEIDFDIVSNPEFLREGKSVYDFTHPDRIVIGTESQRARDILINIYKVLYLNNTPFVFTDPKTSELIKYASNAFLAVKISYINELANLAEKVGANIRDISRAMGMDGRISPKFLHAGPGYGGSCFPKDTKALVETGKENDIELRVVRAAIEANETQPAICVEKICREMGTLEGKTIAILGLSFKPETDDTRDAPSHTIIKKLIEKKAKIKTFCPQGTRESKIKLAEYKSSIEFCSNEYHACDSADALVIVTEWNQFRGLYLDKIAGLMKDNYFFDLRNIYSNDPAAASLFKYRGIGTTIGAGNSEQEYTVHGNNPADTLHVREPVTTVPEN